MNVTLQAVVPDSEENIEFFASTPSGQITLSILRPEAVHRALGRLPEVRTSGIAPGRSHRRGERTEMSDVGQPLCNDDDAVVDS